MPPPSHRPNIVVASSVMDLGSVCGRFGLWDDIIAEPLHENPALYPTAIATAHYARGIAFASQGLIAQAEEEQVGIRVMPTPRVEGLRIGGVGVLRQVPVMFYLSSSVRQGVFSAGITYRERCTLLYTIP